VVLATDSLPQGYSNGSVLVWRLVGRRRRARLFKQPWWL